jgi:hypothetical protein
MKKILFISTMIITIMSVSCAKQKAPIKTVTPSECPDTISFASQIAPMINDNCAGCHTSGQAPNLSNYTEIAANADAILKTLKAEGAPLMPQGGPALNDSLIKQFSCWILQGKQDN